MGSVTEFKLPDVGEGLTDAEIVAWHVSVGDLVNVNDVLVEIETAKSLVELPSPATGRVTAIHVAAGQTINVGTVLVTIGETSSESSRKDADEQPAAESEDVQPGILDDKPLVLVGTGPSTAHDRRRQLTPRVAVATPGEGLRTNREPAEPGRALAKPPVRALAKRLGVDLAALAEHVVGVVTREDIARAAAGQASAGSHSAERRETRTPIRGVRKVTAAAMVQSAFTAPHVTEWLTVDVTATMELVARLKTDRRFAGVRLTPLVFVARALLLAVKRNPGINARWDEIAQEVVEFHYVNLGIAAATPRGLMVPNIKEANGLDLLGLATSMTELVQTAREGKTSPEQMSRGTITITNIGALGVDAGTPILNPGEAAILAFGNVREMPWVLEGQIVPRRVTQLALSFDHRVVDGELGSKVLVDVARILQDPSEALLYA